MTLTNFDNANPYDGLITERHGPARGLPTEITYSAIAIGTDDKVTVTEMTPRRRVSEGAKVIAAEPGDWCKIIVSGDTIELYVPEGVPFKACATGAPDSPAPGPSLLARIFGGNR